MVEESEPRMKTLAAAVIAAFLMAPLASQAQSATPSKAKSAKKAPAKVVAKASTAKKPSSPSAASAPAAAAPAPAVAAPLSDTQLAIARDVHTGTIACELGAHVTVSADEQHPGYFRVVNGKRSYYMHPVESRTGAIRMEDEQGGAMWLQLGNKSMLLDQKIGQRVADECAAPQQLEFAARMKAEPATDLLGISKN